MIIPRQLAPKIRQLASQFPVVAVTGPRQSGKSTLLRHEFADYRYVSFEDPDIRRFASEDPRSFIALYPDKVIIDEAQRVPSFFSYLQTHVDNADSTGMYLLSGSMNFMLLQAIDQSLAGRVALTTLLPLSRSELHNAHLLPPSIYLQIFRGFYPRIYHRDISPLDFFPNYIDTYVERDVRQLSAVHSLSQFSTFLRLCAARVGQLLNLSSLANDMGIDRKTAASWLSLLEASYICFRLEPNFHNYNKRLVKTPKLYFYDTGLACSLLGIKAPEQLPTHYMLGALFENLVINQFVKSYSNRGIRPDLTFWRDSSGTEVDLIDASPGPEMAYEIKHSATFNPDFFNALLKWSSYSYTPASQLALIYGGSPSFVSQNGRVISFPDTFQFS